MKTESNIRPASQFEIEALPPIEGRSCTVILYDNIQGHSHARLQEKTRSHRNTSHLTATQ